MMYGKISKYVSLNFSSNRNQKYLDQNLFFFQKWRIYKSVNKIKILNVLVIDLI